MATYSAAKIQGFIDKGANKSLSNKVRGDALEDLFCYLLDELPGVRTRRNAIDRFKSAEIDISVANAKEGRWLQIFPNLFMVECKNWDKPVDSKAVSAFILKLTQRCAELGIIVATNGVTGDQQDLMSAHHAIAMAQQGGRRVLVVTMEQLRKIRTTEDFEDVLCDCILTVFASGGF